MHFDVKLDNVLVEFRSAGKGRWIPVCKLADFGLTKEVADAEKHFSTRSGIGTKIYTAPEILGSGSVRDHSHGQKSDSQADSIEDGMMLLQGRDRRS